jgi:membrane protein DedA with SNARE-associated domain
MYATTHELTGLAGWAAEVVRSLGGPGVGALVALENVFPPLPSEVILPLAGFLAGRGDLSLGVVLVWALVGSLAGSIFLYGLGAALGPERVYRLVAHVPLMSVEDVRRGERWFDRHGESAVLLGRLIPGVRSLISIPAGVTRMPMLRFLLLTALGSAAWNALLIGAGYALGASWHDVGRYSDWLNYTVVALLVIAVATFFARRLRTRAAD